MSLEEPTQVAIGCQGGGSHAAFTAGALETILDWEDETDHEIVAVSGTSGGAMCAVLAWYGLLDDTDAPGTLLRGFWQDIAATNPADSFTNTAVVSTARAEKAAFQ